MNETSIKEKKIDNFPSAKSAMQDLAYFLDEWNDSYKTEIHEINLFNTELTKDWSTEQREKFARIFYHIRGHFDKFLWLLGTQAPDNTSKEIILDNIREEFGGNCLSHEALYFEFAKALGFNIEDEFLTDAHNLPFVKEFNAGHLSWLSNHGWHSKWAAFAAYERLDNIDYSKLLAIICSLGVAGKGQAFFIVHNKADHFDRTYDILLRIWQENKDKVREAFAFIQQHQITMWRQLSTTMFSRN